jgi:diguanylate cyclase (GGDEF)-like protein
VSSATDTRRESRPRATLRELAVGWLPEGRALPDRVWQGRHRWIVNFALLQAVGLAVFGLFRGYGVGLVAADFAIIVAPTLAARAPNASRRLRMLTTTTALMLSAAVCVDFAGGSTEAHFYFFVMVGVVALYQDWSAFGLCILITVVHHAVMGSIVPRAVYGNEVEWRRPIVWALIHGGFVLAVSVTHLLAWRASEDQDLADPLTQLPNRTAFNEGLAHQLRASSDAVSVLFVDLDDFKRVNDRLGHLVGDHALQHAASRMTRALRDEDLLARLGGDEFAIVVSGSETIAMSAATRISAVLQPPIAVDGREAFVRASIGVAGSDTVGSRDPKDLVRSADLAMYIAKGAGKNQIARYDAHAEQAIRDRDQLRVDLRHAIARGELRVHYQPVMSGDTYQLVGMEALARWEHPTRGAVTPAEFIPIAEETGDIRTLGAWMLQTAAAQVAAWRESLASCANLQLAVNVSPIQLDDDDFVDMVSGVLEATGLPATQLTLEITESMLVRDRAVSTERLNALRAIGIRIAIDDFGTGYSSLSYLADLPADIVKIDQSFVADLHPHSGARVLVKSIIDLARSLGLDVVAEGVEETGQAEILHELGCPKLQGYLYARPMGRDACSDYLETLTEKPPSPAPTSLGAPAVVLHTAR